MFKLSPLNEQRIIRELLPVARTYVEADEQLDDDLVFEILVSKARDFAASNFPKVSFGASDSQRIADLVVDMAEAGM